MTGVNLSFTFQLYLDAKKRAGNFFLEECPFLEKIAYLFLIPPESRSYGFTV